MGSSKRQYTLEPLGDRRNKKLQIFLFLNVPSRMFISFGSCPRIMKVWLRYKHACPP